jgi:mycofactocin precursor
MEQDTTLVADTESVGAAITDDQAGGTADLVEEELLIEEISIDGMCGVY